MTTKVGKDVDSWCTRCKLMLAHTIEAVVGGKVTRVHCNTCGAQHAYRPKPPGQTAGRAPAKAGATRRGAKGIAAAPKAGDYATLVQSRDKRTARRYAVAERFRASELIDHPTFGLGLVTADKGENKIEVLFSDGAKTLVHGR